MQELAISDSSGGLKPLAVMEVSPCQESDVKFSFAMMKLILLFFRAPWRSVCCGCSGRDTDPARHEISPYRHRKLSSQGAQEDCRMVRGTHVNRWRWFDLKLFPARCSRGQTCWWWWPSLTGERTRLLTLFPSSLMSSLRYQDVMLYFLFALILFVLIVTNVDLEILDMHTLFYLNQ